MNIEPLEARIAPAAIFTYTDVDGDAVTVQTHKGANADLAAILTFSNADAASQRQLQLIDFTLNPTAFAGTDLHIVARRTAAGGDGLVNVGAIDALGTGGAESIDLRTVTIRGDLGKIEAGDQDSDTRSIRFLSVQSMGQFGTTTQLAGGDLNSGVRGVLADFRVAGNLKEVILGFNAVGSVKIGGSLIGGDGADSGVLFCSTLASLKIGGNLEGGGGSTSGSIVAFTSISRVYVVGSVLGGIGDFSGSILSNGPILQVKIGGNLDGRGGGEGAGKISAGTTLSSVIIRGSVLGGAGEESGRIRGGDALGVIEIGGDVRGGGGDRSGRIVTEGFASGRFSIGGSLVGAAGAGSGSISSVGDLQVVAIGGDVAGGSGSGSGSIRSSSNVAGISIRGSLLGGSATGSGELSSGGAMGAVRIEGDLVGGSASGPVGVFDLGCIHAKRLASLTVVGSILAGTESDGAQIFNSGTVRVENDIGPITIGGSILGSSTTRALITARGQATVLGISDRAIQSLTVGGRVEQADILAGYDTAFTPVGVNADAQIGAVIVGDWIESNLVAGVQDDADAAGTGNYGDADDQPIVGGRDAILSRIASIHIRGTALGTDRGLDHYGFVAQQIDSFRIGTTVFPLLGGPRNDLSGQLVGITGDLRVRER